MQEGNIPVLQATQQHPSGAADVQEAPDPVARRGGHHPDDRHLEATSVSAL